MHCVDLGESFPTHILLQNLASIQLRTSPVKFACSPRTDSPGVRGPVVSPVFYGKLPYPPLPGSESLLIGQKAKEPSAPSTSMPVGGIIVMLAVVATITKRAAGGPSKDTNE